MSEAHDHGTPEQRPVREERRPARPDVEEMAPGILRIQLPIELPGLGHVNCYAMEDDRGIALVDPGLPGPKTRAVLKKKLKGAALSYDHVHTVVVTHSHPDHFGQAASIRRATGAEVVTHRSFRTFLDPTAEDDESDVETAPLTSDQLEKATVAAARHEAADPGPLTSVTPWGGSPYTLPRTRRVKYWLMRHAAGRFMPIPSPSRRVADHDVISLAGRDWIAVHTPGHTIDHLCLWDPTHGVMISGDHVLPTITPHISGLGATVDPLKDFFESLDRMSTFADVKTVLPAHGLEFGDLGGRADDIKRHHHERLDTLREASDTLGMATVGDYMRALFKERSWGSMAESETYAHLEHLRLLGDATVDDQGEVLRYAIS